MTDSSTTEIIVIRHGETVWNADGRQQGHLDSDLSDLGKRQAEAIAQRMAGEKIHALYSSDLGRAYHTAEYIARKTGHEIITETRLRERNLGIFQGLTFEQIRQQFPEHHDRFNSSDPDYVIPQGESIRQRHERVIQCLEEIACRDTGRRIVIIAHGGVLRSLFRHVLDIGLSAPRNLKLYNASINTFYYQDGTWMLGTWGDVNHLGTVGTIDDW